MADTKKEYTSNLHPKGDLGTTVYPNVKSENIIDKDTTAYTAGKVPDSSLVSRSLDGISENLETTKIQVATNKNNIETLQGNYTGLQHQVNTNSSDIALTKTQVETNKTNIAKNTQDIENLSAVTPNGINVDANGYAILEHDGTEITGQTKKVKFAQIDKSVSFSEVTIPTVSDLKTQDGSTFSGGSKLYNGAEYLPTFDIATLKDTYVDINSDQTIVGTKTWENNITENIGNIIIGKTNDTKPRNKIQIAKWFYLEAIPEFDFANTYLLQMGSNYLRADAGGSLHFSTDNSFSFEYKSYRNVNLVCDGKPLISLDSKGIKIKDSYVVTEAQLNAKQDKRFTHTVEIHYASNGSYFCFTGISDKNTPIDSVEDLTTVFANRDFGGTGIFGSEGLSKIHVGSSINDTTFKKYTSNGEYATPSEETFATVFNPTGFTITDSVSAL